MIRAARLRCVLIATAIGSIVATNIPGHTAEKSSISVAGPMTWCVKPAPDELPVGYSAGKPGARYEWHEYPHENTEQAHFSPLKEKLEHLRIVGIDQGHLLADCKVRWRISVRADDGDYASLVGQIYRWDATKRKLLRIPDHPLTIPQSEGMRRFVIHGVQSDIHFRGAPGVPSMHLTLEAFGTDSKPAASHRVQILISQVSGENLPPPDALLAPRRENRVQIGEGPLVRSWLVEGDHITSKDWDFELKRIIPPDPKKGIVGWADFYLNPVPPPARQK